MITVTFRSSKCNDSEEEKVNGKSDDGSDKEESGFFEKMKEKMHTKMKEKRPWAQRGRASYDLITGRHRQVTIEHRPHRGFPHRHMSRGD